MPAYNGWMRNYRAMGRDKLYECLTDLERGWGPAVDRAVARGGILAEHRFEARLAWNRYERKDSGAFEPCVNCNQYNPIPSDDYVCVECRNRWERVSAPGDNVGPEVASKLAKSLEELGK